MNCSVSEVPIKKAELIQVQCSTYFIFEILPQRPQCLLAHNSIYLLIIYLLCMYVKCVNNWNHVNELFIEVPIKKADGTVARVQCSTYFSYSGLCAPYQIKDSDIIVLIVQQISRKG